MNVFKRIATAIRGGGSEPSGRTGAEQLQLRRWDASKTSRLNQEHWRHATDLSINQDLETNLRSLRARANYEATTNPIVAGVINTHATDLVGKYGPTLQVQSSSDAYNKALEAIWNRWFLKPDINGKLSGPQKLRLWVRDLWTSGEYLEQKVNDRKALGPVKMRLLSIDPRRMDTPHARLTKQDTVLGVQLTKTGKPVNYFIQDDPQNTLHFIPVSDPKPIAARNMIHGFETLEAGQVRGVPILAQALQVMADLRDYDDQVLDAARQAADWAVYLFTNHPDAPFSPVNESVEVERRTVNTMPPGWEPKQMQGQQPSTKYIDYRTERQRDLGRPVGMPAMIVRGDSSNHNFASARFDAQVYQRANRSFQEEFESDALNGLVDDVAREAFLAEHLPARPDNVLYIWTWDVPPHVDPAKEAKAEEIRLRNKTLSLTQAAASHGLDFETIVKQLVREKQQLTDAGLLDEIDNDDATGGGGQDGASMDKAEILAAIEDLLDEVEELKGVGNVSED